MTPSATAERQSGIDSAFADLVEELTARFQSGEAVDGEALLRDHPEYADQLRELLPALALLANLSQSSPPLDIGHGPMGELGDFRLIREVGRGGMGVVYEAEQLSLSRRVALKVLPFAATMDPRQLLRFQNEAKAAASLRHENIVHVYGVGCERGVHFYAMEFVDGRTLAEAIADCRLQIADLNTENRDQESGLSICNLKSEICNLTPPVAALSTKKDKSHFRHIAELVAQAADALEHAHSMGIVHRDVKPGNLLLDNAGKIYVSDFGLARFGPDAGMTMTGDMIGTLRYMSPEQALAKHGLVDHRTDVYSLGATLYELLTLRPAVEGADKQEILKRIAFEEPTPLRRIDKSIPAELETIALKALAKEPGERYATAGEFAEDLRRWLGDRAIKAKPATPGQRATKWARRHRGLVRAVGAMFVLAVAGLAVSTWLIWREKETTRQAKDQAELSEKNALDQAAVAKAVQEFLLKDLLDQASASEQGDLGFSPKHDLTVKEAVDRAAARIPERFGDQPRVAAAVHRAIGAAYNSVGEPALAVHHLTLARDGCMLHLGADHAETLDTMSELAAAYVASGQMDLAISILRQNLATYQTKFGPDHRDTLVAMGNLAAAYTSAGRFDLARPLFEQVLPLLKAKLGPDDRQTLATMDNLATLYQSVGRLELALPLYRDVLAVERRKFSPGHPDTLITMLNLANVYRAVRQPDLALPLFEEAVTHYKGTLGPYHPTRLTAMHNLAGAYREAGKLDQAQSLFEETLALRKVKPGPDHPDTLATMASLAVVYNAVGKLEMAIPLVQDALHRQENKFGPEDPVTLRMRGNLGETYRGAGKLDLAIPLLKETFEAEKAKFGFEHHDTLSTAGNLAHAYQDAGKLDQALPLYEKTLEGKRATIGPESPNTLSTAHNLANAWRDAGKLDKALQLYQETLDIKKRALGPDHPSTWRGMMGLASGYHSAGRFAEASKLFEEALALQKDKLGLDHHDTLRSMFSLSLSLIALKDYAAAETLLLDYQERVQRCAANLPVAWQTDAIPHLVRLYDAWGKPEQAGQWRAKLPAKPGGDERPQGKSP